METLPSVLNEEFRISLLNYLQKAAFLFFSPRFGNEFWLLLAGTRFGCSDPVSACYRFDRGQGARSGVECSVVDATTSRQLLVTSFSCLNFGTWLPVSQESVCLFPLVSLLFLAFPISLAGFTQIPSVIHTQIYAMPRGDINWYCLTFFELQNQSLIHFN